MLADIKFRVWGLETYLQLARLFAPCSRPPVCRKMTLR